MATAGLVLLLAASAAPAGEGDPAPTFTRDVAPIVFQRCAACHHPGEAAPFSLLSYEDLRRRAKQIALVTRERLMPPWLPDPSANAFVEDRSLTSEEIETIQRWVEEGAVEGDPADLPPAPEFPSGWQLGEPDAIARMPEEYLVPAEGSDIYRNFVLRSPVEELRHVRAVEFQIERKGAVHHGVLFVDGSRTARAQDAADPEPGYEGMELGVPRIPDGQFVSWTPGKVPLPGAEDIAWRLDPYTDLVLQLHLRPTGKPEPVQVALGLHFAERAPTRHPLTIRVWSRDIDIPAGERSYLVEESYTLPVAVEVLVVYPHAHYLATDVLGLATLPDGTRRTLIHIPRWNFNWQQEYSYAQPLALPAGTVVSIRYVFDNSAENPFNPSSPPRRVRHGYQSSDEMAELLLHVLPAGADRPVLYHDFVRTARERDLLWFQRQAAAEPDNLAWNTQLATYCLRLGRNAEAVAYYRALVEAAPEKANPWQRLGQAQLANGELDAAMASLRKALELEPAHPRAHLQLGKALFQQGQLAAAEQELRTALAADPSDPQGNTHLGELLRARGQPAEAARAFERALQRNPEHVRALTNLAELALERGELERAEARAAEALHIEPDDAAAQHAFGLVRLARGDRAGARVHLELALRFEPEDARFAESLRRLDEDG
jgi:tetratricopeptide (TPR) repeat protein